MYEFIKDKAKIIEKNAMTPLVGNIYVTVMEALYKSINLWVRLQINRTTGMSHDTTTFSADDHVPKFWDEYFHAKLSI